MFPYLDFPRTLGSCIRRCRLPFFSAASAATTRLGSLTASDPRTRHDAGIGAAASGQPVSQRRALHRDMASAGQGPVASIVRPLPCSGDNRRQAGRSESTGSDRRLYGRHASATGSAAGAPCGSRTVARLAGWNRLDIARSRCAGSPLSGPGGPGLRSNTPIWHGPTDRDSEPPTIAPAPRFAAPIVFFLPQIGRWQPPVAQICKSTRGNLASTRRFSAASWTNLGLGGKKIAAYSR